PGPASGPPFVFTDPSPARISTLSLHDALPICLVRPRYPHLPARAARCLREHAAFGRQHRGRERAAREFHQHVGIAFREPGAWPLARKSTRLNSSHVKTSYAVFCLKKKIEMSAA